ncbi:MAG TPA: ATP-binding protein [Thermodesulfovibrionia bacterium]|nr:ATP-binding protein [Thermodesulfovibrionia bacterium]
MKLEIRDFIRACRPDAKLDITNPRDKKYYINFSSVRGGDIIKQMFDYITDHYDKPTYQLFTGHIGCGKSTELLRLKALLIQEGYHVVYFEAKDDLEMRDLELTDILLAIAVQVDKSLENLEVKLSKSRFKVLYNEVVDFFNRDVQIFSIKLPKNPVVEEVSVKDGEFSISTMFGGITANTKASKKFRDYVRQYWEPRASNIIEAINQDLLDPAVNGLKVQGKNGLVVIVDSTDMIDPAVIKSGKPQPEYLFVDQYSQFKRLNCHIIYAIPLSLRFSDSYFSVLKLNFENYLLPMVPVKNKDSSLNTEGMDLMRQMVLARAFPDEDLPDSSKIFDTAETFDKICLYSGGHARNMLRLIIDCLKKNRNLPIADKTVDAVLTKWRSELDSVIDSDEWKLLKEISETKKVKNDSKYQTFIKHLFVFGYEEDNEPWYDVNPLIKDLIVKNRREV